MIIKLQNMYLGDRLSSEIMADFLTVTKSAGTFNGRNVGGFLPADLLTVMANLPADLVTISHLSGICQQKWGVGLFLLADLLTVR